MARAVPTPFFHSSEGMVVKFQDTGVLPAAVISASVLTKRLLLSGADLKGMAKPMPAPPLGMAPSPPVIALRATSSVTHHSMKSRVAWMSSAEAFLLTHQ